MSKSDERSIAAKREFSKLELELVQTANATLKFLKRFIKDEIQEVKKNASDLRYLATRIRRTKQSSGSEVNAARMCMNQTAEAMIDLIRAARVYDHNYASRTTPVDDDSGSMEMEAKLFGRTHHYENSESMEDLFRSSSSEFKVRVTEESAKTPDTVEAVVRLTLRSSFGGLNALRSQIATTEKALAPSEPTRRREQAIWAIEAQTKTRDSHA
ncbi:hypothetical protein PHYSODRAFT_327533 [Phytophthora sojae]|uniref:Uncharacterized protein n=1 Tax=Phytophthora sojae (strain P6497) TaxID=1094619 RepID=G4Z289_PHYSP|nr:hypothetical protein PHYSODRAFT_327533 [Phytophthora sojae]EGZ19233.1 hypothetical protein PHYSODRAFT_327533 [Phytophthora sojae]|eukprot:XP_009521950.1 hypothetical protein PHYSODRAFT_327533 [Phytophthora sojae]